MQKEKLTFVVLTTKSNDSIYYAAVVYFNKKLIKLMPFSEVKKNVVESRAIEYMQSVKIAPTKKAGRYFVKDREGERIMDL